MQNLDILRQSGACLGSSSTPLDERPALDRATLGPFVGGYVKAALKPFPNSTIEDISEGALQQIVRDCVAFYWRNRLFLEPAWDDPFSDYTEFRTGRDFFLSRNGRRAFINRTDPFDESDDSVMWDALEASAIGFGPAHLEEDLFDLVSSRKEVIE